MPNLVDNPKLLTSTHGDLQVMDSEGNFPIVYPGGAGIVPDNWWFLGGPDYGTFINAGGIWSFRLTPGGGRSVLLDVTDPVVQQSGGITQVIPVNQTEIKPIRLSAYVAAEGCTGSPRVNVSFVGYPPGWPGVGGGDLTFDLGTYDFVFKKGTFIPTLPVKYLFLHILHRGFSAGKAWYGAFSVEELAMPVVSAAPNNVIINPNFTYTGDDANPTGWDVLNAAITDEASPLGTSSLLVQKNGSVFQRNICLDTGKKQQKMTIYAVSLSSTMFRVKITLLDRYRHVISEKTLEFQANTQWKAAELTVLGTELSERADVEIRHIDGTPGLLGGVLLTSQEFTPAKIVNVTPAKTMVNLPVVSADTTAVISIGKKINPNHIELDLNNNNTVYLTDGFVDNFVASKVSEPFILTRKATMNQLSGTEYTLDPWTDNILGIEVDGREMDQLLRISHVVHPDAWLVSDGGSIPAGETRYYCVTALTSFGETDRSNEVRAITGEAANNNRVPIEITPVEGAVAYRVYMTQTEDADQPWEYSVADVKKLIWDDGQPHLVTEVTAAQLRDAGYVLYDNGAVLQAGTPSTDNTAKRWEVDTDNNKVVFDAASTPAGTVQAVYSVEENINAALYLAHADKHCFAGGAGIYESDVFTRGKAKLTVEAVDILAMSYFGELWYMTINGDVKNITGTTCPGEAGFAGFCWLDEARIARITASGWVKIFDLAGNILQQFSLDIPAPVNCFGLATYFDKLVTFNVDQGKFIVFNLQGQIVQVLESPINGVIAWNIAGVNLVAVTSFTIVVYRIHGQTYYAKMDKGYYLGGNPQRPTVTRVKLPGEVEAPTPPEILPNGTFADGSTFPAGFLIYGPKEIDTGFSTEVAIPGTRALYFSFPYSSWKSVNKYGVEVIGGRQYSFTLYTKSTANSNGLLGINFKDKKGIGTEVFYTTPYEPSYKLRQVIVQAPVDAVMVDFRYLVYGSDAQGITYFLNVLSLKEEVDPETTFEHLYNGNFAIAPTGADIPSGWEIAGDGADDAITAIENPVMQSQGKALKLTLPAYEIAGWTVLQSQAFAVTEGDGLEVSFYYRRGNAEATSMQVSLYYLNPDGSWGPANHKTVSLAAPAVPSLVKVMFDPNPAVYPTARLRIWPKFEDDNWFELCSVIPKVSLDFIINADFSEGLAGWDTYGNGVSIYTDLFHSSPKCARLAVDGVVVTYTDVRQRVDLNQTVGKKVLFSAWAAGTVNGPGYSIYEVQIRLDDGTDVWNPAGSLQKWPIGNFGWTQVNFDYTPPPGRKISYINIHLGLGWGGTGTIYVDDVSLMEEQDVPVVDEIVLDVPYTELNTETIKQVRITAQLLNAGSNLNQKGLEVVFEASPDLGTFEALTTNAIGKAQAIYTLPEVASQVTIKASYEALESIQTVTIRPLVLKSRQEPTIDGMPYGISQLFAEIIVPREKKLLPDVSARVGRWEVFRPTVYNAKQMLDYDMHYSPMSSWPQVKPDLMAEIYPQLLLFHYFDDLSDYPHQTNWQEITAQRKEWFCVNAVGNPAPFGDGRYYYNWRNMEVVQWYVDRLMREHSSWSDGIYIDDFWGESYNTLVDFEWGAEASSLLNYRSVRERLEASARRLRFLRDELHRQGKYMTTNLGCARNFTNGVLVPDTKLLAIPFDGYLLEVWLYSWIVNPEDIENTKFTLDYIRNEIDFVQWAGDNGKWVVCLARSSSELYLARIFCLAAFLMGKHAHAYYVHTDWGSRHGTYGSDWHDQLQPECFIQTGAALERYHLNNGLFSRRFENCVALLNMNEAAQDYTLPVGDWYTMRGDQYSGDIQVQWRQGLVLVKERP